MRILPVLKVPKILTGANTTFCPHLLFLLHKDYRHVKKIDCLLGLEQPTDGIVRAGVEPAYQSMREHKVTLNFNHGIESIFVSSSKEEVGFRG